MSRPVAVVTGASRGIGKRFCIDLASHGYDVVATARSSDDSRGKLPGTVEATAERVRKEGGKALAVALDVRDEPGVAKLAGQVFDTFGRCDLVVNNAALAPPRAVGRASYTTTKAALEAMTRSLGHDLRKKKVAVNCIRLDLPVWTEGFAETLPPDVDIPFEDAVIMSDALLWFAEQPRSTTGEVLSITELRKRGVVRPETRAARNRSS